MFGWVKNIDQTRVLVIGAVTVAHAVLLAWALTLPMNRSKSTPPNAIEIEFAEASVPDSPPRPEPPPEPIPDPLVAPTPRTVEQVPPVPSAQTTLTSPSVLTQNAPTHEGGVPVTAATAQEAADPSESIDPQTIATVLQNVACQDLIMTRDETCPKLDPFDVAEASKARAEAAPSGAVLIGDYGPKSMLENFMNQKDRSPFIMPGMSVDLFTEGMAPGAYDAQRIRSGREPLWSQEMKDGFTRDD
ncbi:MAG: hypothetical protein AAF996_01750 [Pseudomonadota bacterium]